VWSRFKSFGIISKKMFIQISLARFTALFELQIITTLLTILIIFTTIRTWNPSLKLCFSEPHSRSWSYFTTDGQSVSMSWCRAHSGTSDQILLLVGRLLCESCCVKVAALFLRGALSDERTGLKFAVQSLNRPSRAEPVIILYCLIWDSPNLEGQVPVFISPRNRVAQLYPWALGSPPY
jgi:hypothetical protein